MLKITVSMPIEVPEGIHCWDGYYDNMCSHLVDLYFIAKCDLCQEFIEIDSEGDYLKPDCCKNLKELK